jgi:FlaA1/EpsC-like NDP-sugar epimerase
VLRNSSSSRVSLAAKKVDNNFVYRHSTLSDMAQAIATFIDPEMVHKDVDHILPIRNMIERYSQDMLDVNISPLLKPKHETVLLTGSTGGLGSEVLTALLVDDRVEKVYALNRSSNRKSSLLRHEDVFRQR